MINWFNIPDEGLSNGGLFEVKELEVTENGTYETKGEMYNKVTVNVEGGGGESDFSIATLTFTNGDGSVLGAIADDGDNRSTNGLSGDIIKIILYKGQALIEIDGTIESTSGNIEDLGRDGWLVTGDCTVTVSGGSPE